MRCKKQFAISKRLIYVNLSLKICHSERSEESLFFTETGFKKEMLLKVKTRLSANKKLLSKARITPSGHPAPGAARPRSAGGEVSHPNDAS